MIILDTHVWIWWVNGDTRLTRAALEALDGAPEAALGVSVVSCWEVAALVTGKKLGLSTNLDDWPDRACSNSRIIVLPITRDMAVASVRLPAPLHRDPADRILIAEARARNCLLLTADRLILGYPHVSAVKPADVSAWLPSLVQP
ncbi:MAG: type II toxin-antitoxin system VapC family toxin [Candidatus Hydrogenedentes bacterium]|nr:type II toxin-antitoxin system VapC family toxin [Candidatus Hydrogenedentota bacterium]